MSQSQGVKYAVDLVMCIDGTGSMSPIIEQVKSSALHLYKQLDNKMEEKGKQIDQLRAKVIVFRDYWADSADSVMEISDFYDLRTEGSDFSDFVSGITAKGGGDEPENGLESLALALNSDWETSQDFAKKRHVVVLYTDASAHSLEQDSKPSHYPDEIPQTFDELTDYWHELSTSTKRLLLFAPDASPWSLMESWDNTIHFASKAGEGLEEFEMDEILNGIANSV